MNKEKNITLFSILPYRLGGLDMMLPLYLKLKELHPHLKIEIAFNDDKAYHDHFRDDFLRPEVINGTDKVHNLKPQRGGKVRNRFFSFLNALPLFAHILSARNPVLIHHSLEESPFLKLLSKAVRIRKGRIFTHFGSYNINIGVTPPDRVFGKATDMDAFLYFGASDPAYLQNRQIPKLIQMGYPRLFSSWKEHVLNKSPELVRGELKKNNFSSDSRLVTVLLPSTIESLFSLQELKIWLKSVLRILRNELPKDVIFLKPHPLQDIEIVEQVLDEIEDKNVKISFMHAGILAASSQFVISHHSTTIVDSMGLLIPTIHYQKFTAHWLKRHPDGSFCLKLNPLWARDESELRKCIATALSENYHVPKIEKILGHKEDLSMFFDLNSET
tara:strand:- start:531 stop:1691 length:1161 start_codon:yes stop_codon:yes gene_type:complete